MNLVDFFLILSITNNLISDFIVMVNSGTSYLEMTDRIENETQVKTLIVKTVITVSLFWSSL